MDTADVRWRINRGFELLKGQPSLDMTSSMMNMSDRIPVDQDTTFLRYW